MVQMLFYLRFKSQLRRTRPDIIAKLEESITEAIFAAGGQLSDNRRFLNASFNSNRIGFWLEILVLIETIKHALDNAASDLSGHALVFDMDINIEEAERLCRSLSSSSAATSTSIWCSEAIKEAMLPFCSFNNPFRGYRELSEIKTSVNAPVFSPYAQKIMDILENEDKNNEKNNILFLDTGLLGIRDGIFKYHLALGKNPEKNIPPLIIRFNKKPVYLFDVPGPNHWSNLKPLLSGFSFVNIDEMDVLEDLLFKERLRGELSPFVIEAGCRFLTMLLHSYIALAGHNKTKAVIIIEDPLQADECFINIIREISVLHKKNDVVFMGINTGFNTEKVNEWNSVFPKTIKLTGTNNELPPIPIDLLEVLNAISVFGRFFPASVLDQIFREEGLNPAVPRKALELLKAMGVIDYLSDPRPLIPELVSCLENMPSDRKDKIKIMVKNRLLNWEQKGKTKPCFNLLRILNDLGGTIDDTLILRALRDDINNKTINDIDKAFHNQEFRYYVKEENVPVMEWIYKTQRALISLTQEEIHSVFNEAIPDFSDSLSPVFRAQVDANISAWKLGSRDTNAAAKTVKGLIHLNQNLKDGGIPSYRYFSFFSLLKNKIDDALEYCSFAIDLAEKTGSEELVKALYFCASINYIYGNYSAAERFILKTEKTALDSGWPEWASRSRFFLGRIFFECGHYQKALDTFMYLENIIPPHAREVLAAWIYRSRVYLFLVTPAEEEDDDDNKKDPRPKPEFSFSAAPGAAAGNSVHPDAALFHAEAAFLLGDYEETLELCNDYLSSHNSLEDDFFFTEQPDWSSGFSQCEQILIPQNIVHKRLFLIYQALAESSLPLLPKKAELLQNRIKALIQEELLSDGDINEVLYLFAWYRILRKTGASSGDAGTALSMAYKRLQRRGGRIDSIECRRDFFSLNYWIKGLSMAAKENKLI